MTWNGFPKKTSDSTTVPVIRVVRHFTASSRHFRWTRVKFVRERWTGNCNNPRRACESHPMDSPELNEQHSAYEADLKATIPADWLADFEAAARRPLETRFRYAFIRTYKPVLDDAPFRAFETTADYRRWCEEHLPAWLGYGRL